MRSLLLLMVFVIISTEAWTGLEESEGNGEVKTDYVGDGGDILEGNNVDEDLATAETNNGDDIIDTSELVDTSEFVG